MDQHFLFPFIFSDGKQQADGQSGKNDMKGGGHTKLDSGKQNDIHGRLSKCMVMT
jgi:hypothetical protein